MTPRSLVARDGGSLFLKNFGSSIEKSAYSSGLRKEADLSSETSVKFYQISWRHIFIVTAGIISHHTRFSGDAICCETGTEFLEEVCDSNG
jgi:hypothetical protein